MDSLLTYVDLTRNVWQMPYFPISQISVLTNLSLNNCRVFLTDYPSPTLNISYGLSQRVRVIESRNIQQQ